MDSKMPIALPVRSRTGKQLRYERRAYGGLISYQIGVAWLSLAAKP
jgi:hypothetical protein